MNIFCVARNYAPHAVEMQSSLPAEPSFFEKPHTALLQTPAPFPYPSFTNDLQHELELVIPISKGGRCIPLSEVHCHYHSVAIGIDFTARDIQRNAKNAGLPWLLSKGFDGSAAISPAVTLEDLGRPIDNISFSLQVADRTVQQGHSGDMIFPPDRLIAYLSQFITLNPGDLIFTGTPAGVGSVHRGDHLTGLLEGKPILDLDIV